ncbi:MAG: hypothetical protein Fur0022_43250 [Anaerolineales bacterium]
MSKTTKDFARGGGGITRGFHSEHKNAAWGRFQKTFACDNKATKTPAGTTKFITTPPLVVNVN